VAVLAVLAVLGVVVAGAALYDHGRRDRIADGVRIDGVDVGGLSAADARERVTARAVGPRRRAVHVHAGDRVFTLTAAQAHLRADVDGAVRRAVAASRHGWLGTRVVHEVTNRRVDENVPLDVHVARKAIRRMARRVAAATHRDPVNAAVSASAAGLSITRARPGRALEAAKLRHGLRAAFVVRGRPAEVTAHTHRVAASVGAGELAGKYPAYIIIDRGDHVLRFYQHLKLADTYPIAVGMQGLETPQGLYDVQWKQTNPSWYVPNSAWAGALAGKVIPPGPDDPIKARWMAFNGGAGIHGIDPSEYGSIGHDASHGCVRMRIPDVIALYARTPVHTPVYVA
jgi:lipoprotein-anchoring transpeptidase ErfK/SrfK